MTRNRVDEAVVRVPGGITNYLEVSVRQRLGLFRPFFLLYYCSSVEHYYTRAKARNERQPVFDQVLLKC